MQCIFILTVQQFVILTIHVNNQGAVTLRADEAATATQEWAGLAPVEVSALGQWQRFESTGHFI